MWNLIPVYILNISPKTRKFFPRNTNFRAKNPKFIKKMKKCSILFTINSYKSRIICSNWLKILMGIEKILIFSLFCAIKKWITLWKLLMMKTEILGRRLVSLRILPWDNFKLLKDLWAILWLISILKCCKRKYWRDLKLWTPISSNIWMKKKSIGRKFSGFLIKKM